MLALGGLLGPRRSAYPHEECELRIGRRRFTYRFANGEPEIRRGPAPEPKATISTDAQTLRAVLAGDESFAAARRRGGVRVAGDVTVADRLLSEPRELDRVLRRVMAPPQIRTEDGFSARVLLPPGEMYDPLFMRDHGDTVWISDDGGQIG